MLTRISLVLLTIIVVAGSAHAGVSPGDGLLTLNVGYASGKSSVTGENIDGGICGLDYQKMDWDSPISGGFSIGYGEIGQTVMGEDSSEVDNTVSMVPIFIGGKYWLGDGEKRIQGYIGAAFGMYFAQRETSAKTTVGREDEDVSGSYTSESALGFGLGIPVGGVLSLGDTIMLDAHYNLNWLWGNDFLDNDIINAFSVGIAFKFGG